MEASTAVPQYPLDVTDADGTQLSTGDRVRVTGSSRFGEGDGTVIGAVIIDAPRPAHRDLRLTDDGLTDVAATEAESQVRIRVRMDNGTDGDDYTASQGRVAKVTAEQDAPAEQE